MPTREVFVDTNVLVNATISTAPLHSQAHQLLERLWNDGDILWISRQILREYAMVVTRPQTYMLPVSGTAVASQLRIFIGQFRIADETEKVSAELIHLLETFQVGGKQVHDANIVATMRTNGVSYLLTHNVSDFTRYSAWITVIPL